MNNSKNLTLSIAIISLVIVIGCARPQGSDPAEKRDFVQNMKAQALNDLYAKYPQAKSQIENSAGYSVFSNINTQLLFFGTGNGYGVATDSSTGSQTYMKMLQASAGIGVALKDIREVIIFNNPDTFRNFVTKGWDLGVQAGVGAKSDEKGAEATGAVSVANMDVIIYQLTEAGIELRTNVAGKKYWTDNELNYR